MLRERVEEVRPKKKRVKDVIVSDMRWVGVRRK